MSDDANQRAGGHRPVSEIFDPAAWRTVDGFDFSDITYHRARDAGVVRIAFDRPEVRNAFRPGSPLVRTQGLPRVVLVAFRRRSSAPTSRCVSGHLSAHVRIGCLQGQVPVLFETVGTKRKTVVHA